MTAVVADAKRGGSAFIAVSHHARLCLGAAARAAAGALDADAGIVFHALDLRQAEDAEDIEAVSILCEHGAYALLARHEGGLLRGVHAADPLLADLLADLLGDRLGRAANLRLLA